MKKLSMDRANELLNSGITHIAAVVKSHYTTTYYNVNPISALLRNDGKWIPAPCNTSGWHGRIGITSNQVDWAHTISARQI